MKKILFTILCNSITGRFIVWIFGNRIPNIRYKEFRFAIAKFSEKRMAASVFFGFYEGAEVRFLERYFTGDMDTIELGASSGILSTHILRKMEGKASRLISVEANEQLSSTWSRNVSQCSASVSAILDHSAVFYDADKVNFSVSTNSTESKIAIEGNEQTIQVPAISLHNLAQKYKVDKYALFCDIEGAELQLLLRESVHSLSKCKHLFIELLTTQFEDKTFSVMDLHELVLSKGFVLIQRHGPVGYYQNVVL